jgi:small subunit ribosomal protein S16
MPVRTDANTTQGHQHTILFRWRTDHASRDLHDRERTKQSMAVRMRLRREGKRKQPYYRVVVADGRSPRDGRFIEDIGYYQPLRDPSEIAIDRDRALYWLGEGVQPSDAVRQLLRVTGIWEEFRPGDTGRQRTSAGGASS